MEGIDMNHRALYATHMHVLQTLLEIGESPYLKFRAQYNPWRTIDYFDGQMRKLLKMGYINYNRGNTILLTPKGKEFLKTGGMA